METINKEHTIQYIDENGTVLAEVEFPLTGDNEITITRTFVDDSLRGQGIASKLISEVLNVAKQHNYKIKATCSYAAHHFEKHPTDLYLK